MPRLPYLRSFRLVAEPAQSQAVEDLLQAEGFEFEPEPFSPVCRRLTREPIPLGASIAAFFGYIYIQDRSSMLPPLALAPSPGSAVLDMCASPGSKSGFLAQLAGAHGFVLANEPSRARLGLLRENLRNCNLIQAATSAYPGEALPLAPASWHYILLDPPCSGWGTADKNPQALKIWQGDKINSLLGLQKQLLRKAASLLAPGGRLAYSTCTTNKAENEAQTMFAERELGLERVPLAPFAGFEYETRPGGDGALLVRGHESRAQGFYISLLTKPGSAPPPGRRQFHTPALIPREALASPICDISRLPPGEIGLFGDKLRFLPEKSVNLPLGFAWQGACLGTGRQSHVHIDPRLRLTIPPVHAHSDAPKVIFEKVEDIHSLLKGQSLSVACAERAAALYWRDLPLGSARLKNGRVIPAFR